MLIANNMCPEHKKIKLLFVLSITEFSKEQNKLSTRTIYHNYYYYRTWIRIETTFKGTCSLV